MAPSHLHSIRVENSTRGTVLGDEIWVADRFWPRLRGLLGVRALLPGQGLLIRPCSSIHMMGMSIPLDICFLDPMGLVLACHSNVAPGLAFLGHPEAREVLEMCVGTLSTSGTVPGDRLVLRSTPRLFVR